MSSKILILAVTPKEKKEFSQDELKKLAYSFCKINFNKCIDIEFSLLANSDIYQELLKIKQLKRCYICFEERQIKGYYNPVFWNEENNKDIIQGKISLMLETEESRNVLFG